MLLGVIVRLGEEQVLVGSLVPANAATEQMAGVVTTEPREECAH